MLVGSKRNICPKITLFATLLLGLPCFNLGTLNVNVVNWNWTHSHFLDKFKCEFKVKTSKG
jgi:hypothetical protein